MAQAVKPITLTINGRAVTAVAGDTIYTAARRAGLVLPGLCASPHLAPRGSCRLCLCEVEGLAGTPASCTTPVRDGMIVRTDTARLNRHRHNILELYLSEHREDVPLPGPLAELARAYGVIRVRYFNHTHRKREAVRDESNPFFTFDNTVCVSCERCVRACDEIQGTFALTMTKRGFETRPMAGGGCFAASSCVSCGACVKECLTGALMERTVARFGPPMKTVRTVCGYCGVGCVFDAGVRDGRIVRMVPADDGPSSVGHACMKGRFAWDYIYAPDRAKLILVVGANPAESHPVIGARIKQAHRRGVPLIVIDPRRTELARLADLHLQVRPGTNVALLNAMGHVIVQEGLLNQALISSRTEGVTDWLTSVALCTPEWAEQITGVPAPLIREAARRYATSGASFCVHGLGVTEHRWGSHGVIALCNLALATGNVGRPGTGINPLRGQNNVQGASDVGALPTYFAGYQPFDDPALAARHQVLTGRPLPVRRGMKTPEMWEAALEGRLKGLWIVGYDVAQSDPNLKKVREALSKLEFLVVQDLFPTETTKLAHLVLPSASFLEKDGTFTNLERRIQRVRKVVEPPDGVLPDQTRRTAIIQLVDTDALEMHPDDAARLGVSDGDLVKLVSLRGEAVLPVVVSERVLPGELFTSFHFPATDVNVLLSSSADESSKCPEYKVSTVRVEKLAAVGLEGRTAGRTRLIL